MLMGENGSFTHHNDGAADFFLVSEAEEPAGVSAR